ncbi:MAG TPA: hypothetical protein VH951_06275 [Dehalococcoidia bacterium]|jgi:hypothetical protein
MLDLNPKMQEALMLVRDGIELTREEEARIALASQQVRRPAAWRRSLATAFVALARRIDPVDVAAPGQIAAVRRLA